jgi:hypothetical protein
VDYRAYMFGDNEAVVTHAMLPHSQLAKRHNTSAYHYVREAFVSGVIRFVHPVGTENPAVCLTKLLCYQQWWPLIRPILFWMGDTAKNSDNICTTKKEKATTLQPKGA